MIDRELNYGRHLIESFAYSALQGQGTSPRILDIGAGSGTDIALVKKSTERLKQSAELIAIESYAPNVERLKAMGTTTYGLDLEKQCFPFQNESLDLVVANQVLEHMKEIFWISHEVSRTLKIGGHFLIGVPNLASFHNRLLLAMGRQPTAIQTASAHIRGFTKHDLIRYFQKTFPEGYELRNFGGSNFYPFPAAIAKPLAKVWPNGAVGIFFLFQKMKAYDRSFIEYPVAEKLETNYFLGPQATAAAPALEPAYT